MLSAGAVDPSNTTRYLLAAILSTHDISHVECAAGFSDKCSTSSASKELNPPPPASAVAATPSLPRNSRRGDRNGGTSDMGAPRGEMVMEMGPRLTPMCVPGIQAGIEVKGIE